MKDDLLKEAFDHYLSKYPEKLEKIKLMGDNQVVKEWYVLELMDDAINSGYVKRYIRNKKIKRIL